MSMNRTYGKFAWLIAAGAMLAGAGCGSPYTTHAKPGVDSLNKAMEYAQEAQDAEADKDHEKAIELNKKALALRPEIGGIWNNLGLALMHRGQPDDFVDAAQAFKQAADRLPNDDRPYQNLGVLYHERGFSEQALEYFCLALDRNPNSITSLRGAISSAKLLGRSEEAGLARLNRGLMMETDPQWRQLMELEKIRVQQELTERARPANG